MTTPPPLVRGVDFLSVPTRDLTAAMEFYGTLLGLPCSTVYERVPGAEFETGNLTLSVMDSAAIGLEYRPNVNPIALHVDDVAAARAELESRGISFRGTRSIPASATWPSSRIPDGNVLMLHHRYAPREPEA